MSGATPLPGTPAADAPAWTVHALAEVDSTQSVLAALAREGAAEGTVVTATHQSGGRGRQGRRWWDAPGESLLLSVLLRPRVPPSVVPQLSLVAAVAVADALASAAGVAARLSWPNDVLVGEGKIAGILAEGVVGAEGGVQHVLVGIGVNVNQREFPPDLDRRAVSLTRVTGHRHDPGRLRDEVLAALGRRYREWLTRGFAPARDAWRARAATLGQAVRLPDGREGVAADLGDDGALLVRAETGALVPVMAGEVAPAAGRGRADQCCS